MKKRFACAVLLLVVFLLAPLTADAVVAGDLASLCGYATPVNQVVVLADNDGGPPHAINRPVPTPSWWDLDYVAGLTVPNVHAVNWIATVQFNPGGATADLYFYAGTARPWRLDCNSTGLKVRTDSSFFGCIILGECQ